MSGGHQDQPYISQLNIPSARRGWVDQALCKGDTEDIWFPDAPGQPGRPPKPGRRPDKRRPAVTARMKYDAQVEFAISICQECPVKADCLADAESRNERYGIWGGKDFYKPRTWKPDSHVA